MMEKALEKRSEQDFNRLPQYYIVRRCAMTTKPIFLSLIIETWRFKPFILQTKIIGLNIILSVKNKILIF